MQYGYMPRSVNDGTKKVCQKGTRGDSSLRRVRIAFAQDEMLVPWTVEYDVGWAARRRRNT